MNNPTEQDFKIAIELYDVLPKGKCQCDFDKWKPEKDTDHVRECPIHGWITSMAYIIANHNKPLVDALKRARLRLVDLLRENSGPAVKEIDEALGSQ